MPLYEPEVAARMVAKHPEDVAVDIDALMDHLVSAGHSLERLCAAIRGGHFNIQNYPLFQYAQVQRWLDQGMPT